MTDEAKQLRREYQRKYYAANREKIRSRQNAYWERKAESLRKKAEESGSDAE